MMSLMSCFPFIYSNYLTLDYFTSAKNCVLGTCFPCLSVCVCLSLSNTQTHTHTYMACMSIRQRWGDRLSVFSISFSFAPLTSLSLSH